MANIAQRRRVLAHVDAYARKGQLERMPELIHALSALLAADFDTEVSINVRGIGTVTAAPGCARTETKE